MTLTGALPPTEGEIEARVRDGLELVPIVARQLRRQLGTRLEVSDLEGGARMGLLDAARTFDPSRGVPFRRWASLRMRGGVLDVIRNAGPLPRTVYRKLRALEAADRVVDGRLEDDAATPPPDASAADERLDEILSGMAMAMATGFLAASSEGLERAVDEGLDPERAVADKEMVELLRGLMAKRPDAERKLLERHYFDGLTFEAAARELGLSKSWASRLHSRAMTALAADLRRGRK